VRFLVQSIAIVCLSLALITPGRADQHEAMLSERALGNPEAPVTFVEYSSLTCPHCAEFHNETLPQIKETYIDTGKVRFVYRDFPLNTGAAMAAMVARCVDEKRFFGFLDVLYGDLQGWAGSPDPRGQLKLRAQLAGLSADKFDACLENEDLFNGLVAGREQAAETVGVQSTPTFEINGRKVVGGRPFEEFAEIIDEELAAVSNN
jgi:protein-disulfide isomerase